MQVNESHTDVLWDPPSPSEAPTCIAPPPGLPPPPAAQPPSLARAVAAVTAAASEATSASTTTAAAAAASEIPRSRLHYELLEFARLASPTVGESKLAADAVETIRTVVAAHFGEHASVVTFGSQACGLALPGSDVDISVLGVIEVSPPGAAGLPSVPMPMPIPATVTKDTEKPDCCVGRARGRGKNARPRQNLESAGGGFAREQRQAIASHLTGLARALHCQGAVTKAVVITAKVPIIKCVIGDHALECDISMGAANGPSAVALVQRHVDERPALRPLLLVRTSQCSPPASHPM